MEEIQMDDNKITGSLPYISKMEKQTMEDELTKLLEGR
jgi:hypothetical protein